MKFDNIHLIINPQSGNKLPNLSCLDNNLFCLENNLHIHYSNKDEDLYSITTRLAGKNDLIAVYGGDGSISDVARALYGQVNNTLGIIPGGTANVISKELGIPQDPEEALALLLNGEAEIMAMDMGLVNGSPFLLRINLGIMADMVITADPELKDNFGQLAYGITALESTLNAEPIDFKLLIDGEEINESGVSLTITNAGNIGIGDFSILPGISVRDGFLDIVLMNNADILSLLRVAGSTLFQTGSDVLKHWRCKEVFLQLAKPQKYICDDSEKKADALHIKVMPAVLDVLVPGNKHDHEN